MYSVYTQPRPGRPRWALASAGALLLITIGLAQGLIELKNRSHRFTLGPAQTFDLGRIRCPIPADWKSFDAADRLTGVVVACRQPTAEGEPARELWILRAAPSGLGIASQDAQFVAEQALGRLTHGKMLLLEHRFAKAGSLPAWDIAVESTISLSPALRGTTFGLARTVLAPAGQMVVFALLLPQRPRSSDYQLLDGLTSGLAMDEVKLAADPAALMQAAGFTFAAPDGAAFVTPAPGEEPVLQMFGGQAEMAWFLDVCRVPLVGKRRPANLVTDCALAMLHQPALPHALDEQQINGREAAQVEISPRREPVPSIAICSARIDEANALLMVGRFEPAAAAKLKEICRSVAGGTTLVGSGTSVSAARETARSHLKALRTGGLRKVWADYGSQSRYRIACPALSLGRIQEKREQASSEGTTWWEVTSLAQYELPPAFSHAMIDEWVLQQNLDAHTRTCAETVDRRPTLKYEEQRSPGASDVTRKLTVFNGGIRSNRVPVDDTYAPEPVLVQAAALVALDPSQEPAIFNTTDAFSETSTYWIATPLGEQPVPSGGGKTARAVRLHEDCSVSPLILYYNRAQLLIAVGFSDGTWHELEPSSGPAS